MDRELDYDRLEKNIAKLYDRWHDKGIEASRKIDLVPLTYVEIYALFEMFAHEILVAIENSSKDGT
jgi:hypothetical protein